MGPFINILLSLTLTFVTLTLSANDFSEAFKNQSNLEIKGLIILNDDVLISFYNKLNQKSEWIGISEVVKSSKNIEYDYEAKILHIQFNETKQSFDISKFILPSMNSTDLSVSTNATRTANSNSKFDQILQTNKTNHNKDYLVQKQTKNLYPLTNVPTQTLKQKNLNNSIISNRSKELLLTSKMNFLDESYTMEIPSDAKKENIKDPEGSEGSPIKHVVAPRIINKTN